MVQVLRYQIKLIALWSAFLLGLLFHTQLGLMPLFHGIDVASSHTHEYANLTMVFSLMLLFYCIPLLLIVGVPFLNLHRGRSLNFGLTVIYTILNLIHFALDVVVKAPGYQLILMLILVGIGFLLNGVTYQWMQRPKEKFATFV